MGLTPVLWLALALPTLLVGVHLMRTGRDDKTKVPVTAVVTARDATTVTFTYPLPNGHWAHATRPLPPALANTPAGANPGDHITVWVNPAKPAEMTLNRTRNRSTAGRYLTIAGATLSLLVLTAAVLSITGAPH